MFIPPDIHVCEAPGLSSFFGVVMSVGKNYFLNTDFWIDDYVRKELSTDGKVIFVFLLINPFSNLAGVYQIHGTQ